MYKIGDFSKLSKTTIKALRYYEKEKLLIPKYIDQSTGYRYYDASQLVELSKIISLRQVGISIKDLKKFLVDQDLTKVLEKRKEEILENMSLYNMELSKLNYLLEEKNMKYEVITKELPGYTVYYKEGVIEDFSKLVEFILSSGDECLKLNPGIKCIEPDYCYVSYLDNEYKDKNIKVRYAQAVEKAGIENENIKFETLKPVNALCVYYKGSYAGLPGVYAYLMKYVEDNNYQIVESPREHYIDGMWNKEHEEDWLTEIQVPVVMKTSK